MTNTSLESESNHTTWTNSTLTPVIFTTVYEQVLNIAFITILSLAGFGLQSSVIVSIVRTPDFLNPHFCIILGMCLSDSLLLLMFGTIVWQHVTGELHPGGWELFIHLLTYLGVCLFIYLFVCLNV